MRCAPPANKPTPDERDTCLPFLARGAGAAAAQVRVVVCLGAFAWDAALRARARAGAAQAALRPWRRGDRSSSGRTLLGCYHPSQQNTFTGRLTEPMLDAVFTRARNLAGLDVSP